MKLVAAVAVVISMLAILYLTYALVRCFLTVIVPRLGEGWPPGDRPLITPETVVWARRALFAVIVIVACMAVALVLGAMAQE